jgi:hypothetical protein
MVIIISPILRALQGKPLQGDYCSHRHRNRYDGQYDPHYRHCHRSSCRDCAACAHYPQYYRNGPSYVGEQSFIPGPNNIGGPGFIPGPNYNDQRDINATHNYNQYPPEPRAGVTPMVEPVPSSRELLTVTTPFYAKPSVESQANSGAEQSNSSSISQNPPPYTSKSLPEKK